METVEEVEDLLAEPDEEDKEPCKKEIDEYYELIYGKKKKKKTEKLVPPIKVESKHPKHTYKPKVIHLLKFGYI
jgi:hypothetical protein